MTTIVANTFNWIGLESIAQFFVNLNEKRIKRKEIKNTIRQLSALTDRELNDMGLTRGDIYSVAHGTFHREHPNTKVNRNLQGWV